MKVIFLDIDGVLNSCRYLMEGPALEDRMFDLDKNDPARMINPDAVNLLMEVLHETDAKIVISSSWRYMFDTFEELKACMLRAGIDQVIDATPILRDERWKEVADWLEQHKDKVTNYAIIDDSFGELGPLNKEKFVRTRWATGITQEHVTHLITILNSNQSICPSQDIEIENI
jgi:hypothetical protein